MSQIKKYQSGGPITKEEIGPDGKPIPALFKNGTIDVERDVFLQNASSGLTTYLNQQNWNKRERAAFMDAYGRYVNSIHSGNITQRGVDRKWRDITGQLSNTSDKFDANGRVAAYLDSVMDNMTKYTPKEKEAFKMTSIADGIRNFISGGNNANLQSWHNLDEIKYDDKNGKYEFGYKQRSNMLVNAIDHILPNLSKYNYHNTNYTEESLKSKLQQLRQALVDGDINNEDRALLSQIGFTHDTVNNNLLLRRLNENFEQRKAAEQAAQQAVQQAAQEAAQQASGEQSQGATQEQVNQQTQIPNANDSAIYNIPTNVESVNNTLNTFFKNLKPDYRTQTINNMITSLIHNGPQNKANYNNLFSVTNYNGNVESDLNYFNSTNGFVVLPQLMRYLFTNHNSLFLEVPGNSNEAIYPYLFPNGTVVKIYRNYNNTGRFGAQLVSYNRLSDDLKQQVQRLQTGGKIKVYKFQEGGDIKLIKTKIGNKDKFIFIKDGRVQVADRELSQSEIKRWGDVESIRQKEKVNEEGYNFDSTDYARIAAAALDFTSAIASFVPGGSAVSATGGVLATLSNFYADVKQDGFDKGDLATAGLGLGMDALSLIPGAALTAKFSKISNLLRKSPKIIGALTLATAASGFVDAGASAKKLLYEPENFTVKDAEDLAFGVTLLLKGIKSGGAAFKGKLKQSRVIKTKSGDVEIKSEDFDKIKNMKDPKDINAELEKLGYNVEIDESSVRGFTRHIPTLNGVKAQYGSVEEIKPDAHHNTKKAHGLATAMESKSFSQFWKNLWMKNGGVIKKYQLGGQTNSNVRFKQGLKPGLNYNNTWNFNSNNIGSPYQKGVIDRMSPDNYMEYNMMQDRHYGLTNGIYTPGSPVTKKDNVANYQKDFTTVYGVNNELFDPLFNNGTLLSNNGVGDNPKHNYTPDGWYGDMTAMRHAGVNMTPDEIAKINADLNKKGLEAYVDPNTKYTMFRPFESTPIQPLVNNPAQPDDKSSHTLGVNDKPADPILPKIGEAFMNNVGTIARGTKLANDISFNNKIAEFQKNSIKPMLKDPFTYSLQVTGDLAQQQFLNNKANEIRTRASQPFTSNAEQTINAQLESNRQANELEHKGFLADNQAIKETTGRSMDAEIKSAQQEHVVGQENRAALLQANKAKDDIEAMRRRANHQSLQNYITGVEQRFEMGRNAKANMEKQSAIDKLKLSKEYQDYMSPGISDERRLQLKAHVEKEIDKINDKFNEVIKPQLFKRGGIVTTYDNSYLKEKKLFNDFMENQMKRLDKQMQGFSDVTKKLILKSMGV